MPTTSVASTVKSNNLRDTQAVAVLLIFFTPVDAPAANLAPSAGGPPDDMLSERALQRLVLGHGLVITESGAGGAPYYRRVLRCVAERDEDVEQMLHTLSAVGNLLRATSYYEGVRCHPLLPVWLVAEYCAPHEIRPLIHAPLCDLAEPEEFLHEAPVSGVDPGSREDALRTLMEILSAKGDPLGSSSGR